jgi:hypothetical protein
LSRTNRLDPRARGLLANFLLTTWAALGAGGCIFPGGSESVVDETQKMLNTPPAIVQVITPATRVATFSSGEELCDDDPMQFEVTVEDLDGELDGGLAGPPDTLEVQWGIDDNVSQPIPGDSISAPTSKRRDVRSPPGLNTRLRPLVGTGSHLVQVIVTDGVFDSKLGAYKANGKDTAYFTSYAWLVTVVQRVCPP